MASLVVLWQQCFEGFGGILIWQCILEGELKRGAKTWDLDFCLQIFVNCLVGRRAGVIKALVQRCFLMRPHYGRCQNFVVASLSIVHVSMAYQSFSLDVHYSRLADHLL